MFDPVLLLELASVLHSNQDKNSTMQVWNLSSHQVSVNAIRIRLDAPWVQNLFLDSRDLNINTREYVFLALPGRFHPETPKID